MPGIAKTGLGRSVAWFAVAWMLLLVSLAAAPANADVGVLLNETLDTSVARITGSGHSAVYFSRICPENPIKLRLCRPGETGSVMSNYTTLGEDQPYEWNIVPLSIYLYGVEDPRDRPLFGTREIKHVFEERYREKYLASYCDSSSCRTSNKAEWREMVAATLSRSIYVFVIETTVEQDREFIAQFNSATNENHFNGVIRNCADFSHRVINFYFPHATKRDYLNDFGMTTPKAIARSFARYGERHPEAHLHVLHFAQLPGTIKRSTEARSGTEQLYHSKKLLVPMVIFASHELPFVAASYLLTGRFNPQRELEHYPVQRTSDLKEQVLEARTDDDLAREDQLRAELKRDSATVVGTSEEWKDYRVALSSLIDDAAVREIIPDRDFLGRLFKYLDRSGELSVDARGALWLELAQGGKSSRIGLSESNVLAPGTDSQWSYVLLLARANHFLKSPKHSREIMPEFKNDWALLESARANSSSLTAAESVAPGASREVAVPISRNP